MLAIVISTVLSASPAAMAGNQPMAQATPPVIMAAAEKGAYMPSPVQLENHGVRNPFNYTDPTPP
jgi:hypothetical protein